MSNEFNNSELNLQRELEGLVDFETRHLHADVMTDKIVRAVRASGTTGWTIEEMWSGALMSWFRPVALVGTLLVLMLAAYNVSLSDESYDMSTTERVFGIHSVTLAAAYDLDLNSALDEN